jgi:hypothetical protein
MHGQGDRSQSETLGVVLLLGLTILSVGALVAYGGAAIDDTEQTVDMQSAEHALSQLDSKVSLVALSEADRQSVSLGRARQGSYSVHPDNGHITIRHNDWNNENGSELIYTESLGEVRYENGDRVLAYQAGGVWRAQEGGGSVMVSPPEFHYRDMTLTLPIIKLSGEGSSASAASANVASESFPTPIYPNTSDNYTDSERAFTNPVQNGTVQIAVQSEYYEAWGSYFETRTDGNVTTYASNETAVLELVSTGLYGNFDIPMEGSPLELRALGEGHPLTDFTVTIAPDDQDSANFSDLSWSLWAKQGSQKFEISLGLSGNGSVGTNVSATVYYSNGTAEQGWYAEDAFVISKNDDNEKRIVANFTGNSTLTYQNVGASELTKFKGNDDFAESVTFDEHDVDEEETFSDDGTSNASIGYVVNHYIGLFGSNVNLEVKDGKSSGGGASGGVNEDASTGYLEVDNTGEYVTYLHVSENNVTVTLR